MINLRKDIIEQLQLDFSKIKDINLYNTDIKEVVIGQTFAKDLMLFPAGCLFFGTDIQTSVDDSLEHRTVDVFFVVHFECNTNAEAQSKYELLIDDVIKLVNRDVTIAPENTMELFVKLPGLIESIDIDEKSPLVPIGIQNRFSVAISLKVKYIERLTTTPSTIFTSVTGIPLDINLYNLSGTKSNLQAQIDAISISGANVWGTITGNINSQTDLINKFDNYSLTGHSHSEYFLNSLTSSLTTDLSSYSSTSHSHNSFTSLTSNLLQSDNIILPSGASNNLPITFRRAVGTTGYEGFYSIGSGIGVITNYAYANAFMSTGFITKKLHLDGDMWQADVNVYRGTGNTFAIQTNTLDRFIVTSAGKIGIGTINPTAFVTINQPNSLTSFDIFCLSSQFFGNSVKVDNQNYFYIYRGYPTVNGSYIRLASDGSGGNIYDNSGLLTISTASTYPKSASLQLDAGNRIVKLGIDTNSSEFVMTPTTLNISGANVSITGTLNTTGDIVANNVSLTSIKRNYQSLTADTYLSYTYFDNTIITNNPDTVINLYLPDTTHTVEGTQFTFKDLGTDATIIVYNDSTETIELSQTSWSISNKMSITFIYTGNSNWSITNITKDL